MEGLGKLNSEIHRHPMGLEGYVSLCKHLNLKATIQTLSYLELQFSGRLRLDL